MIPVKLTLQGLYSYQQKQVIDFAKLTEAHLFGIFGAVGSGKSAILDAITFAIYGETERMNARDNRSYNMMNLKSDELLIEYIFKDSKDAEYLTIVKGKRNSKRFEDVRTLERSAYKKTDENWEPVELDIMVEAVGLSYENFKRTVIIPQGKFQEFLQLGNKDRTQMMKELFNLGKFELYPKVASLESKNNLKRKIVEDRLNQLGGVTPEQLIAAGKRLDEVRINIADGVKKLEILQKEEKKITRLKELFWQLEEKKQAYQKLIVQEEEYKKTEERIKVYEYCIINFKGLLETHKEIAAKVEQLSSSLEQDRKTHKDLEGALKTLHIDFEKAKSEYDKRDVIKQEAEELQKIAALIALNEENREINGRIAKGQNVCKDAEGTLANLKQDKVKATEALKNLKKALPDIARLSEAREWFAIRKSHEEALDVVRQDRELLNQEQSELDENALQLWTTDTFAGIARETKMPEVVDIFAEKVNRYKEETKAIDEVVEHLKVQEKLEQFAAGLEEGKPCPLCGALSHPDILNAEDVSEALQKELLKKSGIEERIRSIEACILKLRELITKADLGEVQGRKLTGKYEECQRKIETHQQKFKWQEFEDEMMLNKAFSEAESIRKSIAEAEDREEKLSVAIEKEEAKLEKYNNALQEIKHQQTENLAEIKTLSSQLQRLNKEDYIDKSREELIEHVEAHQRKLKTVEARFTALSEEIAAISEKKDRISGKIQANEKMLQQEETAMAKAKEKIEFQLAKSSYPNIEKVKEILRQTIDVDSERKKVEEYYHQLKLTLSQLQQLEKEIGGETYDEERHVQLKEEINRLTEKVELGNQEIGKLNEEIKKLKKDLEDQNNLKKQLESLELRGQDISTLKQMFKGSGFVNYVSSVHLQNLCSAANDRFFKLTQQKLSLELTEDNNFQVRDFMNGGKVRSVKTLSGGQTFQASLSLALSLADSIQKFTASSQNFFFLDEGFGSLDKDSLDIVFDTLKSLRNENRIVGVISHVEDMQQEIDIHLKVVNEEEHGSRISNSWESM